MATFTQGDVRKLLKAGEQDRLEKAWLLAPRGPGCGEVCGLVWDDVDCEAGELNICRTQIVVDPKTQESTPKAARGNRGATSVRLPGAGAQGAPKGLAADRLLVGVDYFEGADGSLTWAAPRCTVRLWGSPGLDPLIELVCAPATPA
jgi:hypothetical protein